MRPPPAGSVTPRVVDAAEVDSPAGKVPLHWHLLTAHAVDSLTQGWAGGTMRLNCGKRHGLPVSLLGTAAREQQGGHQA